MAGRLDDETPSLSFLLVDALAFWLRRQGLFWMLALPVGGLAAGITYVVETNQQFIDYRQHWGWDFLFALIYAMFLDRWIKEALLDGANDCDEADQLRRSMISWRFFAFAMLLFGLAWALAQVPVPNIAPFDVAILPWLPGLVAWTAPAALFALMLPAVSANEPMTLRQAWSLGRPAWTTLVALIGGAALFSLLAGAAAREGLHLLTGKSWAPAVLTGAARGFDCLVLAFAGYALAALFRQLTDWQQPEPADYAYRGVRARARKA